MRWGAGRRSVSYTHLDVYKRQYLLGVAAIVLALATPFRLVHWGSVEEGVLPASAPSRQMLATQAAHFGGTQSSMYLSLIHI